MQKFRLLAGLLLLGLAVAAVAVSPAEPAGFLHLQQLPADKWEVSDGQPVRQNIFCKTTLAPITRTTSNASKALAALCDAQDQSAFSSGSALDTWMAARFINHSTSLDATRAEQPVSTEPNTPWMLADVVLSSSQEQRRADSFRKVRGDAQLDLMLCSDPSCTVLVDLVKVRRSGEPTPKLWYMATSGITTNSFQTSTGTATGLRNSDMMERKNWLPPDLAGRVDALVHEVVWQQPTAGRRHDSRASVPLNVNLLQFATDTKLASVLGAPPWDKMNIGHYKVTAAVSSLYYPSSMPGGCVSVVWPNHTFLWSHGWGQSHPECATSYKTNKFNFRAIDALPDVVILDSMFPQAHLLRHGVKSVVRTFDENTNRMLSVSSEDKHITNHTSAMLMGHDATANPSERAFPSATGKDAWREYLWVAGWVGGTLDAVVPYSSPPYHPIPVFFAHAKTGCTVACKPPQSEVFAIQGRAHCGHCLLLHIGTATIATVPMHRVATDKALLKLQLYNTHFADTEGPWCDYLVVGPAISVLVENVSDPSLYAPLARPISLIRNETEWDQAQRRRGANVVANCSFWDSLGVGFVAGPNNTGDTTPLTAEFEVTWWAAGRETLLMDSFDISNTAPSYFSKPSYFFTEALQGAVGQAVAEAVRLLDHQVAQELATTDSTKTWLGACWDLSVVVLGIVAMASGRADGEVWLAKLLHKGFFSRVPKQAKVSRRLLAVGKALYCCVIVPLGLIVAPATVLASDLSARGDNTDGGSSDLGLLSTEVDTRLGFDDNHILVGVVSVRTTTVYDPVALGLLCFNLALAVLGTLSIMWASASRWPQPASDEGADNSSPVVSQQA